MDIGSQRVLTVLIVYFLPLFIISKCAFKLLSLGIDFLKIILIFSFLTSLQAREDSSDVKISVGSQLDLGSDSAIEVRSTEQLRRDRQELKAEYKDARKTESKLQSEISRLEERMTQDDNNASLKPGLLHEKETLLEELRRFQSFVRSEGEKVCLKFFFSKILKCQLGMLH